MRTAAAVAWMFAALGGVLLASTWIASGGLRQDRQLEDAAVGGGPGPATPPEPARQEHGLSSTSIFGHGGLALVGLGVWLAYVLPGENRAAASIAALVLLPVVALGLEMFRRWLRYGKEGGVVGPDVQETPADAHLSPALVYVHGLGAALTVVLVIAAAVKIA